MLGPNLAFAGRVETAARLASTDVWAERSATPTIHHTTQPDTKHQKGTVMHGYGNPIFAKQLHIDRQERLQREAGRSRLFRESKRLRSHERKS